MVLARLKFEIDNEINNMAKSLKDATDTRTMWKLEAYQDIRKRIGELEEDLKPGVWRLLTDKDET